MGSRTSDWLLDSSRVFQTPHIETSGPHPRLPTALESYDSRPVDRYVQHRHPELALVGKMRGSLSLTIIGYLQVLSDVSRQRGQEQQCRPTRRVLSSLILLQISHTRVASV